MCVLVCLCGTHRGRWWWWGTGGPGVDGVEGNGHSQPGGYIGGLEGPRMLFGLIRDVIR